MQVIFPVVTDEAYHAHPRLGLRGKDGCQHEQNATGIRSLVSDPEIVVSLEVKFFEKSKPLRQPSIPAIALISNLLAQSPRWRSERAVTLDAPRLPSCGGPGDSALREA
jgi:hypothetical protein